MDPSNVYGHKIKNERIEQCLTQRELAEMSNKEQSYISGIETGNIKISTAIFMEIMAAMGYRISICVDGEELLSNDEIL